MVFSRIQNNVDKAVSTELGHTFEKLVFLLLRNGWQTKLTPLPRKSKSKTKSTLDIAVKSSATVVPGGKGLHGRMHASMKAMVVWNGSSEDAMATPAFAGSNFPVVDVADARNRGFNMTVGPTHSTPTVKQVKDLRVSLGLSRAQLLHIVYLVLPAHFPLFNVPNPRGGDPPGIRLYKAELPSPLSGAGEAAWKDALAQPPPLPP
jgi:hypothetical protein